MRRVHLWKVDCNGNLNIWNYVQTLVECLPLFACTEKRVLPQTGPFSQVLSHIPSSSKDKILSDYLHSLIL